MAFGELSKETAQRKGAFLREATGLVREMNWFDVLAMNSFNISAGLGLAFVLYVAPAVFFNAGPTGIPLGVLLATLGGLSGALMFSFLTAMVPRSVADYTIVTRAVHPALGFATNWTWAFWNVVWAGILTSFVSNWALYDLMAIYGTTNNVPWMYNLAYNTTSTVQIGSWNFALWSLYPPSSILNILIGTIIIASFAVILSVGPKAFLYFQRAVFSFGIFSLLVVLAVMATANHAEFVNHWNSYASTWGPSTSGSGYADSYSWIAAQAGSTSVKSYLPTIATLGVIPVASWSLAYGQMTTAVGGEVKRPSRNLPLGAGLSVAIAGIVMALGAYLFINVVGLNFLSGAISSYYQSTALGSGPWFGFYPAPYFDLFTTIIAQSPLVTLIVGIGFLCWIVYYPGLDCLANTRALLAWSFDRVAPSYFGKVSDRFHTPIRAVMLFSFLDWIAMVIFSLKFSLTGSLTATLAVFLTMFLAMGIVGLVFPFLKRTKPIFEQSPFTWKIGPVPVLSIVAAGWLTFLGVGAFFYITENALATNTWQMAVLSSIAFLSAFPLYYLAKAVRRREGIDLALAYREIPPE